MQHSKGNIRAQASVRVLLAIALIASSVLLAFSSHPAVAAFIGKRLFGGDPDLPAAAPANGGSDEEMPNKEEYLRFRAEQIARYRGVEKGKPFNPQLRIAAVLQMERQQADLARANVPQAAWTEIGPNPIPNGQVVAGASSVSGRVSAIAVHPTNANIVYVGTANGGLYRSTDGGATWTPLMDGALSLAIGSIAIAPSSPDTVYVGTGEPEASCDSFFGVGIYRITNASSASPTLEGPFGGSQIGGASVSEIAVDPTNAANIFATTVAGVGSSSACNYPPSVPVRGLFRSFNATSATPTFTKLAVTAAGENLDMYDMAISPGDGNRLLVSVVGPAGRSGVWLSTNALTGATFTRQLILTGTDTGSARTELAINYDNSTGNTTAFAASAQSNGTLYRSVDGGATWAPRVNNGFCGGQCFYDIAVAVDPTNADKVYLGGTGGNTTFLFSTNGGLSFGSSVNGLHTDTQAIAVAPSSPSTIFFGSDGGIWKSTNSGANWTSLNNTTFRATEFESVAVHPTDPNFSLGGTQDNGTNFYSPSAAWSQVQQGDGGFTVVDQSATNTTNVNVYSTYFNTTSQELYVSYTLTNQSSGNLRGCYGGVSHNGIPCGGAVLFYAPLEQGPGTPNTIYYGANILYRSADTGANHTAVSQDLGNPISAIGISPQNDNVRIVGTSSGQILGTTNGSTILSNFDPLSNIPNTYVGRAVIDPNNVSTAYVTLCAYGVPNIWKSTTINTGGPTWTAANHGLPQTPVSAFAVDPNNSNNLYAGTDIGVYASTDAGASWRPLGTGLPALPVFDLAVAPGNVLRIATHGRGMWQIALGAGPTLSSAVSRKVHGTAGAFDIDLTNGAGVEPRLPGHTGTAGVDHKVVFTFADSIANCGTTTTPGGTVSPGPGSDQCTVDLTGVANAQRVIVTLTGVTSAQGSGDFTATLGVLLGDTTGEGTVNSGDIAQTKSRSGQIVDSSNFTSDVTVDGNLGSADIALVKTKSGTVLP
ncbi:MAG TPA: hypothetical protein VGI85_02560 [Chthoniobacterales bacterium]